MTDAERAIYTAFLTSAMALGPRRQRLSWFGRNRYGLKP